MARILSSLESGPVPSKKIPVSTLLCAAAADRDRRLSDLGARVDRLENGAAG
jgi:hypothetical protein